MIRRIILPLIIVLPFAAQAQESIQAVWRHELSSTRLVGYKENEQLVYSWIITGTYGVNATVRYTMEVKVDSLDKPFTATRESVDEKEKQTLMVTLHKLDDPKEIEAEFEHIVYQDEKVKLKFSGVTRLVRLDSHSAVIPAPDQIREIIVDNSVLYNSELLFLHQPISRKIREPANGPSANGNLGLACVKPAVSSGALDPNG